VEVQIVGDGAGRAIALGERECSVQRRHQKLIEESPAPALSRPRAAEMQALAAKLAASVNYRGAGTMEFIVPAGTQDFYFIEMNTRLQVEHPVTEMRTGLDLVAEQLAVAERGAFSAEIEAELGGHATGLFTRLNGHAIEARIVAEDARNGFRPSVGELAAVCFPGGAGIRVDAWAEAGLAVSEFYDSLLGKVVAWGQTRDEARGRLIVALRETVITPVQTSATYLASVLETPAFSTGVYDTGLLRELQFPAAADDQELAALATAALQGTSRNGSESASRPLSAWQNAVRGEA